MQVTIADRLRWRARRRLLGAPVTWWLLAAFIFIFLAVANSTSSAGHHFNLLHSPGTAFIITRADGSKTVVLDRDPDLEQPVDPLSIGIYRSREYWPAHGPPLVQISRITLQTDNPSTTVPSAELLAQLEAMTLGRDPADATISRPAPADPDYLRRVWTIRSWSIQWKSVIDLLLFGGMAASILLSLVGMLLPARVEHELRRWNRGQCPHCAFPRPESATLCPECGRPLDAPEVT